MKKILLTLAAVIAVTAGVVGMSAFEAHIINVTAHIENALKVDTTPIAFGTVFPQEYTTRTAKVALSDSFMQQDRINDVEYKIVQKPKPIPNGQGVVTETTLDMDAKIGDSTITVVSVSGMAVGDNLAIGYHGASMERGVISAISGNVITLTTALLNNHLKGEKVVVVYKDLCKFLSKMPDNDPKPGNDTGVPSYFGSSGCTEPSSHVALGKLANYADAGTVRDILDTWTIDLKVPPVKGYVGQDWPASCMSYVVEEDSEDYGCDLWIEVTGFTKDGEPVPTPTPAG